jgi:hypothetical protein
MSTAATALFSLAGVSFDYEPYPIGYAQNVLPADLYRELAATYPPIDAFKYMPQLGKKYSLSEVNNPDRYWAFLRANAAWDRLYREVKSESFVTAVLDALARCQIDLGLRGRARLINDAWAARRQAARAALDCLRHGTPRRVPIKTRFEFSMLPADGGSIRPHTDAPNKLITLVVSLMKEGEWDPAFGGGTAVLRPNDVTATYNQMNKYLDFPVVSEVKTFPFTTNQCVVFVKTFNSLHAVYPMTGGGSPLMRKTLTINIETY